MRLFFFFFLQFLKPTTVMGAQEIVQLSALALVSIILIVTILDRSICTYVHTLLYTYVYMYCHMSDAQKFTVGCMRLTFTEHSTLRNIL